MTAGGTQHPTRPGGSHDRTTPARPAARHATTSSRRHIGPTADELERMLAVLGVDVARRAARPRPCRRRSARRVRSTCPPARTEADVLAELRDLADRNRPRTSLIGMGYYGTVTPPV